MHKKENGFWGNTITVINNFADKVLNLTLKDVKIDVSDTGGDNFEFEDDQRGKAALSVQGKGNVEIELDGNNELKSGASRAGLEKTSTGKLTLKDDNKEAGSLTATGGASAAGIGGDWNPILLSGGITVLAGVLLVAFLGTRLGLSIRATGDNTAMVRASSINPAFTITVGLCVSGALCALSGGLLAQYQKSCDINVGTGMVTIALASLIIGETLVGKRTMLRRILGVVFGSCLYRFIVAVALRFNVPAAAMKLVSAIIVAVAISMPAIREHFAFEKRKHAARARRAAAVKEGK